MLKLLQSRGHLCTLHLLWPSVQVQLEIAPAADGFFRLCRRMMMSHCMTGMVDRCRRMRGKYMYASIYRIGLTVGPGGFIHSNAHTNALLQSFEQTKKSSCFANARELDAEGLYLNKEVLHVNNLIADQRLQEHAHKPHKS